MARRSEVDGEDTVRVAQGAKRWQLAIQILCGATGAFTAGILDGSGVRGVGGAGGLTRSGAMGRSVVLGKDEVDLRSYRAGVNQERQRIVSQVRALGCYGPEPCAEGEMCVVHAIADMIEKGE